MFGDTDDDEEDAEGFDSGEVRLQTT